MFVLGERKIFVEIVEIVKIARNANEIMIRMLQESRLDFESLTAENHNIQMLEKESDEIAFIIKRDITNGAVSPTILDNLLACVDVADSLVDNYYYLARQISRIAHVELSESEKQIPQLDSGLLNMLGLIDKSLTTLQKLLKGNDTNEIMRQRREIERLEEEGDEIKDNAFDQLYGLASGMHFIHFTHYSELLHKLDDILDACEDLSDLIVTIMISISK